MVILTDKRNGNEDKLVYVHGFKKPFLVYYGDTLAGSFQQITAAVASLYGCMEEKIPVEGRGIIEAFCGYQPDYGNTYLYNLP